VTDIVIQAENLGKKYTIGHQATNGHYLALRDVLVQNARSFWRATTDLVRGKLIPGQRVGRGLGAEGRERRDPARGL
jgi:hypothetical protein